MSLPEPSQLEVVIAALEAQRMVLGDAVAEAALAPLRARLAALAAPPAAEQTLKQVSVLFLDLVGSTTLAQQLDPEDVHAVIDGALASFTRIVESHQGKVLQYAGDSLLAVFGADEAREDDAERAVHTGLALLAEGRRQGDRFRQQFGHDGLDVRVGLHTGSVLLGGGVDAEGSIRGTTVHIAARMEQSAPAGALRISHSTYSQVRGVFDVDPQPPLAVKGLLDPIVTYLVLRAKPRAFRVATRGIEGVETRMVGRDAELQALQSAFERLFRQDRLQVVTVVAEAGIGKSRLLYEFENWAEARPEAFTVFRGRAQPQTRGQPYGLLRDILTWRLQIADGDSMEIANRKIEQGIAPLFNAGDGDEMAQAQAHLLGHLIGLDFSDSRHVKGILDDARQIRDRGFRAAAQMFRRLAARSGTPIVLMLDDLHWADDGSLDFLAHLFVADRDVPMLVLGLARPELFERRADWAATADAQRIDLEPLDRRSSRLLAAELLKKLSEVPAALRELITGGAEGNPFYMEELVKMLVDEGAIETGPERWTVQAGKLLAAHVPQTLTGVLQARLDGLQPAQRLALQQASVIGHVFWDRALEAIDPRAPAALAALVRRDFVVLRQEASFEGVREYAFKHQILHHVTYDTVLRRARRDGHARVGAWLAGLGGSRGNEFLGQAADHFEKAGDSARAGEFFTRATEHAADRYAHEATLGYAARALVLIGEGVHRDVLLLRWRVLDVRERTLELLGRGAEEQADIDAMQRLADALDDDGRRGEVAWRSCLVARRGADFHAMERTARKAMTLADRAGAADLKLRAKARLALALCLLGDAAAGKAMAEQGLAAARAQGRRAVEARFLNALAVIAGMQDDLVATLELSRQVLPVERELGNRRAEAMTLGNLGISLFALGEFGPARRYLEEGLRLTRAIGDLGSEVNPLVNLSQLALLQGDLAQAAAHAQTALDISLVVQDPQGQTMALCLLGDADLALARFAGAAAWFERALAKAQSIDDPLKYEAAAGLARLGGIL